MSEEVYYEQFAASPSMPAPLAPGNDLRRLSHVPVELTVEIGRARMTVGETLELRPGSIVSLNRMAGEPVDLLVNGTQIARGEVVVMDEEFALRLTEVVGGDIGAAFGAGQQAASGAETAGGPRSVAA